MYNEGLARGILEKLDQAFPRKLHLPELQKELPAYQELPRSEWLLAVQALRLDGALNGKFLPEGSSIADAAALYITERGRSRAREIGADIVVLDQVDAQELSDERLTVFLCHSSGDKKAVRSLYAKLMGDGFKPWLDEEEILPGQDWDGEIRRAVRASHVVVVCLSKSSITKEGYLQKEIRLALDVADEKPEGTIFLIPARLDVCQVPERLSALHRVDLFASGGYDRLVASLRVRDAQRPRAATPSGKNRSDPDEIRSEPPAPLSLAEKLRLSLQEKAAAEATEKAEQERRSALRQAARAAAPSQFESLAVLLRARGELLNGENLPGFPEFKFVPVNHRLDAGKFAIELSPYAAIESYSVRVLVGLHPNAAQFLAEIPNIPTHQERLIASMDRDDFCWRDDQGILRPADEIIESAAEVLCNLILKDIRNR